MTIEIQFDGGCQPNPGNKYGSYEVRVDGRPFLRRERFALGYGTNNEAEFESLLTALDDTLRDLGRGGADLGFVVATVLTDSTIVRNRLRGTYRSQKGEAAQRMYALNAECLKRLLRFKAFRVEWRPRLNNVMAFGH